MIDRALIDVLSNFLVLNTTEESFRKRVFCSVMLVEYNRNRLLQNKSIATLPFNLVSISFLKLC